MEKKGNSVITIVGAAAAGLLLAPAYPLLGGALLMAVAAWGIKHYREHSKLAGVFRNCGLVNHDGQVLQLREKRRIDGGVMYRYSLPPGFCVADVEKHIDAIEGFLGKKVTITTQIKDAVIEAWDDDIEQYDYEFTGELEIGRGRGGKPITVDFNQYPHLLIAGETGSGKSTLLRALITNMILQGYKLHLIDLKGGTEFGIFRHKAETFARAQRDAEKIITMFADEIDRRYDDIFTLGKCDESMMALVIDEFAEITDKNIMQTIASIAARGRACGCNLIIATQRPDANILTGAIKANMTNVVGLKTLNEINSRIIIDKSGLERLRGHGHGIFKCAGDLTEFQAPWLSEKRARELIK